jgi:hypothetical protein
MHLAVVGEHRQERAECGCGEGKRDEQCGQREAGDDQRRRECQREDDRRQPSRNCRHEKTNVIRVLFPGS